MKLFQLAYACRVYMVLDPDDNHYHTFLDKAGDRLDFKDSAHMDALLDWLRKWGCRQFALDHHKLAVKSIREWAERWNSKLPDTSATLESLSEEEVHEIGDAYAALSQCVASKRARVGPTGAAKILFAARPSACPPWDASIRGHKFDHSSNSYCKYLAHVKELVEHLCTEAAEFGITPEKIPLEIGQPRSTLLKLVDEYEWVAARKGFKPLELHHIAKWYTWSR
jgi:hypothetical protein